MPRIVLSIRAAIKVLKAVQILNVNSIQFEGTVKFYLKTKEKNAFSRRTKDVRLILTRVH